MSSQKLSEVKCTWYSKGQKTWFLAVQSGNEGEQVSIRLSL